VIATASPAKHAFLSGQPGVVAVHGYDDEISGVDVVLDGVGEDGYRKSLAALGYGGRLAAFGLTAALGADLDLEAMTVPFLPLFEKSLSFAGVTGDAPPALLAEWVADLFARIGRGELAPRIDRRYALEDAADAHRYLHDRRNIGKVILAL
jgi:NADPH2:quinone reductase